MTSFVPSPPSDPLEKVHQRIRTAPKDPEAHLDMAIKLIENGSLEHARNYACVAATLAPRDWPGLELLGVVLFELGQLFPWAFKGLHQAMQNGPVRAESLRMLAALFHRKGEVANACRCMADAAQAEAIVGPRELHLDRPNILRLRSVEKSYYGIKTNKHTGLRYCWLKGGHFSTKHLIDSERVNIFIGTVVGDNLHAAEQLPDFALFMNGIGCPDLDPVGLEHIEAFMMRFPHVPVINPPAKVRQTTRLKNAKRLGDLPGVTMPQTELIVLDATATVILNKIEYLGMTYPLIVRHQGTQTGKTLQKVETRSALEKWLLAQPAGTAIYATTFMDCRRNGYYRKTRAFFIDGKFYPVANLSSDTWQIHSGDRYRVMSKTPQTREEEKCYLQDPEAYLGSKAFNGLHAIRDAIDLDFFGIDFTIDPEGRVRVFEANAAMRHNFDHAENFPYTRPYLERISKAFADMINRRALIKSEDSPINHHI